MSFNEYRGADKSYIEAILVFVEQPEIQLVDSVEPQELVQLPLQPGEASGGRRGELDE